MHRKITRAAALALSLAAATAAHAGEPKQTVMADNPNARALEEQLGFSQAVVHGDTIHLSGVVTGPRPGEDGLGPAYERIFTRLDAILTKLGATWDDVLVVDSFHKGSVREQVDAMVPIKNRYIKAPFPTWTAVGVADLYDPGAVTEIKLTVRKPG